MELNLQDIPLPTVIYSGITTNNPGQKYECENSNYNYYLASMHNHPTRTSYFSSLCISDQCTQNDIEVALEFADATVYAFSGTSKYDGLAIAGFVIVGVWATILTFWSIFLSCREQEQNEYIKKSVEEPPINSLMSSEVEDSVSKPNFKLFNFYEGYSRIFEHRKQGNILAPLLYLSVAILNLSYEFSYRQTIASNQLEAMSYLDSFWGVFLCNMDLTLSTITFIIGVNYAYGVRKLTGFRQMGRYFFDEIFKKWLVLFLMSLALYSFMSLTDEPLNQIWIQQNGADCPAHLWESWFGVMSLYLGKVACLPWLWLLQAQFLLAIVASPCIVIFRTSKKLGYALLVGLVLISTFVGFGVLDHENVVYEPTKLLNMSNSYVLNFQNNILVRSGAYFLGILFGLFLCEGLGKSES